MAFACDDSLVQMYVEGSLQPVERTIMEEHLASCSACRKAAGTYKALMWDLGHPREEAVPPELGALSDRLMTAWEREQAELQPSTWRDAPLLWTRTPVVGAALQTAGEVGQSIPRAGMAMLSGMIRLVRRGGGRR
ncbi:MAG TPA: zf-HC2 domain-containing protein [Symbiobacteriaceae bacterium]|nr:zf-HC2 domain-containing protein [Symbiobacteriaceae bacterium]